VLGDARARLSSDTSRRPFRSPGWKRIQRTAIRSGQGPLRPLWAASYELLLRLVACYLRRGRTAETSVYVKGSFAGGEPVYGLSDLGLIAVVRPPARPGQDPCAAIRARWRELTRRMRPLSYLVNDVPVYWQPELPQLASTCFRYGLDGPGPDSLFFSPSTPGPHSLPPGRSIRLAMLPGLWPFQDWRLVSGPDLRPRVDGGDPDQRRLAVGLELQFWWRLAFRAAAEPDVHWAPYLCAKLIAEPLRMLLWLGRGERHLRRDAALRRALQVFPEESAAIEYALDLNRSLHRVPAAPLAAVLPAFVRLSARVVEALEEELEPFGSTGVRLAGAPPGGAESPPIGVPLPLCDWRALARPPGAEEMFVVEPGRVDDLDRLERALADADRGRSVTLLHDGLIFRPKAERQALRSVSFDASDPISAAVAAGRATAQFPNVPGWSARDTATRAVAEHRAWLRTPRGRRVDDAVLRRRIGGMFSAARAALFLDSIRDGDPVLPVTFAATAEALADRLPGSRGSVEAAYESYSAAGGRRAAAAAHDALAEAVAGLACYAVSRRRQRSTCQ